MTTARFEGPQDQYYTGSTERPFKHRGIMETYNHKNMFKVLNNIWVINNVEIEKNKDITPVIN